MLVQDRWCGRPPGYAAPSCMKRFNPFVLIAAALFFSGCTAFDSDHRRTLDWLDRTFTPSSSGARAALLPVAIPVGLVGLATDAVIVNPVMAIDDAWGDTVELLWTPEDETPLRRALIAPLAALATPVVFASDWLWRCLWPIDPRDSDAGDGDDQ